MMRSGWGQAAEPHATTQTQTPRPLAQAQGPVLVNCHAGPEQPQIIEVTPEKQVVWTFKDFQTFGNSMPVAVVLDP